MKNLHLIPTNKPSRFIYSTKYNKFMFCYEAPFFLDDVQAQHKNIYITNDEEIKEGEIGYIIDKQNNIRKVERVQTKNIGTPSYYCNSHSCDSSVSNVCYSIPIEDCKKIILTTDEDLIKDCVQAIDDEFLEWFVKNPSCEKVEVEEEDYSQRCKECGETVKRGYNCSKGCFMKSGNFIPTDKNIKYKIIIPKEEPKQEIIEDKIYQAIGLSANKQGIINQALATSKVMDILKKEIIVKQETLEEAAEKLTLEYELGNTGKIDTEDAKEMLIEFAKYQAERSYSEAIEFIEWINDPINPFIKHNNKWIQACGNSTSWTTKELFEQFKKK